jgi:agmatinase
MSAMPRGGFLDLPDELQDPRRAKVHILPVPYEATVSYETGTREGPAAIVTASQEVELYDPELDAEPCLAWGVHTMPALSADWPTGEAMMSAVAREAEVVTRAGKLLVVLGGEHSISPGVVRGVRAAVGAPFTVVQIDAHADLRDTFRGSRFSHACAMRRILEENEGPTVQLGIRSYSAEEAAFIKETQRITIWPSRVIHQTDKAELLRSLAVSVSGKNVYVTIDVDGLDPAVVPATGTPEPDGLGWQQTLDIIRTVAAAGRVVAMDCVELAPRPGLHASEFSVAKLLYRAVTLVMRR